jgi:ankyrin repeat protein
MEEGPPGGEPGREEADVLLESAKKSNVVKRGPRKEERKRPSANIANIANAARAARKLQSIRAKGRKEGRQPAKGAGEASQGSKETMPGAATPEASTGEGTLEKEVEPCILNVGTPFEVCALFGPEVKSPRSLATTPVRRPRRARQALLSREGSGVGGSGGSTEASDLPPTTSSGSEGGFGAVLERAERRSKAQVRSKVIQAARKAVSVCPVRVPTVREKVEEEAKRVAVSSFLASPRRARSPALGPGEEEPARLTLSDVIVAAAAAKAIKLKSREEVPPPSAEEVAERQCRRLLALCQRAEWEGAGEALKVLEMVVAPSAVDRKVLTETADSVTGNTPVMYAAIENKIGFMERMVALGCNVNKRNKENYTALHFASMYSREDTVSWLLAKHALPGLKGGPMHQSCVHLACARQTGQSAIIVRILLGHSERGSNTTLRGGVEGRLQEDLANSSPLFAAIEAGNTAVCRELLTVEPGKQLGRKKQPLNDTAMHLAARRKDAELAKLLIEAGAQVDLQNREGQTVLHLASIMGDEAMVRVLFMARANANIVDNEDRAAIHLAAERGYSRIVEFLVEKFKASIYQRTRDGSTLMHIAAINGHPETAMILYERGVPLLMPNRFGARGIHTAAKEGHVGVVNSLIKKGETADAKTGDGRTALHIAVEVSHLNSYLIIFVLLVWQVCRG